MRSYDSYSRVREQRGFSMLEMMVSAFLGVMIIAMTVKMSTVNQRTYQTDLVRTRLNQNLRSALDLIGLDARQAGENLTAIAPAIEIVNGSGSNPDELVVRRNLLDEVLNICTQLTNGTSSSSVQFAKSGATSPGCIYANQTNSYNAWRNYRTANGNAADVYLYDSSTKKGQFFRYTGETNGSSNYFVTGNNTSWTTTYSVGSGAVYMMEEWRYKVNNKYLQLVTNGNTASPLNVVYGITNMQVSALMQDGTTKTSFTVNDDWTDIKSIQVVITGTDTNKKDTFTSSLTSQFFPRNVLSN